MELEEYAKMYELEEGYWWFKGKRKLISSWIEKHYGGRKRLRLLDVGCGTGIVMKMVGRYGEVYGLDFSKEAITFCKKRGLKNLKKGSADNLPYKDGFFDAVTILDVLSSRWVKDQNAVKEIFRVLKKGGRIFITDSAMKCLWLSRHDMAFQTAKRYNKREMIEMVENAGFHIEKISYFNTGLFLLVFISRKINNLVGKGAKSDVKRINPLLNWLLFAYYSSEISLLKYISYPFGVSLFVVGRK